MSGDKKIGALTLTAHINTAELLQTCLDLIACDAYAVSFQSMGQYRTALMQRIAEMLQEKIKVNVDTVVMPRAITAENGAKAALIGEFNVTNEITCHHCEGEGKTSDGEECKDCEGGGILIEFIPVPWDTIKNIYKKAVAACEVKP